MHALFEHIFLHEQVPMRNTICVDGVGSGAVFEDIWEANTYALILCFSCNVS
jgi:hypothetical protein